MLEPTYETKEPFQSGYYKLIRNSNKVLFPRNLTQLAPNELFNLFVPMYASTGKDREYANVNGESRKFTTGQWLLAGRPSLIKARRVVSAIVRQCAQLCSSSITHGHVHYCCCTALPLPVLYRARLTPFHTCITGRSVPRQPQIAPQTSSPLWGCPLTLVFPFLVRSLHYTAKSNAKWSPERQYFAEVYAPIANKCYCNYYNNLGK